MRTGIGYDIHALKKGRRLVLGGVRIPFAKGLLGHSDGDVVLHAIVDAVLGAVGEGDIGDHFPDTEGRYQGVDSLLFVRKAMGILRKKRMKVLNVDTVVIAEAPKLLKYKGKMKERIAKAFGIPSSRVGVKAKTHEGFGAVGRGEAIACLAVVSVGGR